MGGVSGSWSATTTVASPRRCPRASEFALRDLGVPVLAPADVQDVLDFGLAGWALSRYAGCWAGLIALTDIMDSALTVDVDLDRHGFALPPHGDATAQRSPRDFATRNLHTARQGVHIRLNDSPVEQEARAGDETALGPGVRIRESN